MRTGHRGPVWEEGPRGEQVCPPERDREFQHAKEKLALIFTLELPENVLAKETTADVRAFSPASLSRV